MIAHSSKRRLGINPSLPRKYSIRRFLTDLTISSLALLLTQNFWTLFNLRSSNEESVQNIKEPYVKENTITTINTAPNTTSATTNIKQQRTLFLKKLQSAAFSKVKLQNEGDPLWDLTGNYGMLRERSKEKVKLSGIKGDVGDRNSRSDLVYIFNPKIGSDTLRYVMNRMVPLDSPLSNGVRLNKANLIRWATCILRNNSFVFTVVRHPEERIASAYSTMVSRLHKVGWAYHRNGTRYNISNIPESSTDTPFWEEHFRDQVHSWLDTVREYGWHRDDFWWDQHLIPQIERIHWLVTVFLG